MTITIEYCTSWGYVAKAVGLSEELLREYKNDITKLELLPSSNGIFEVKLEDKVIFSKFKEDRYPEVGEIIEIINNL